MQMFVRKCLSAKVGKGIISAFWLLFLRWFARLVFALELGGVQLTPPPTGPAMGIMDRTDLISNKTKQSRGIKYEDRIPCPVIQNLQICCPFFTVIQSWEQRRNLNNETLEHGQSDTILKSAVIHYDKP